MRTNDIQKPNWANWGASLVLVTGLSTWGQTNTPPAVGPASAGGKSVTASSQPSDAEILLNLFQKKGLISSQDATEAREALANRANGAVAPAKSQFAGLPDWVTAVKLTGDFRGRFEENGAHNSEFYTRDRYRYRLRLGGAMTMGEQFEVGVRLASGNPQTNPGGALVGGQPITANQDLNSLESRKFIWIDAAYAKWTPVKNSDWTFSTTIGKMDNPFQLSNMVWDYDIDPEGLAAQIAYNINDKQVLKANGAFFVLDELNQPSGAVPTINPLRDPYVLGAQLLWESKWTPKWDTSLGVAAFDIANKDSLSAKIQPFYNSGNTRDGATGALKYNFNPIIGTASTTYRLDTFPLYPDRFPIKIMGELMNNPGASANNTAWRIGGTLGRAGKKGQWEINYRYQRLEADSWFDALEDDDNGAFYAVGNPQLTGTGKLNGWFGGTNVKGHLVQATYSFTDFLSLTFTYYLNELIINAPGQSSNASHFMADLMWRF